MKKRNLVLQAAIASALAFAASNAMAASSPTRIPTATATANSTFTGTGTQYATESIPATGLITIKAGAVYDALNTTGYLVGKAGAADKGLFTIGLPVGVTFVTSPLVTSTGFLPTFTGVPGPLTFVGYGAATATAGQTAIYDMVVPAWGIASTAALAVNPANYYMAGVGTAAFWTAASTGLSAASAAALATLSAALVATPSTPAAFGAAVSNALPTAAGQGGIFTLATSPASQLFAQAIVSATSSGTVTLQSFTVTGATNMLTAGGEIILTAQSSGFGATNTALDPTNLLNGNNDAAPVSMAFTPLNVAVVGTARNVALSVTQFGVAVAKNANNAGTTATEDKIDVGATSVAKSYVATATSIAAAADLGLVTVTPVAGLSNPTATGPATLPTQTLTITGDFTGANSVFAVTGAATGTVCPATVPAGGLAGVIAVGGGSATIANLPAAGGAVKICKGNSVTTLLKPTTHSTSFLVGAATVAGGALSPLVYNGNIIELNILAASTSRWKNFIRVTNPTTASATLIGVLTTDQGVAYTGVFPALAAGQSILHDMATITPLLTNAAGVAATTAITTNGRMDVLTPANAITVDNMIFDSVSGSLTTLSNNGTGLTSANH